MNEFSICMRFVMRNEIIIFSIFLAILLCPVVLAGPGEVYDNVTQVVDGDTIYVQIQGYDSRIGNISVRLADIDCPERNTDRGLAARQYAFQELSGSPVSLDLDDITGKDKYCRWVAVVFLQKQNGTLANFNRMLVDSGHACIWNFTNNEFDPANWWNDTYPLAPGKKDFSAHPSKMEKTTSQVQKATMILALVLMVRLSATQHPANITVLAARVLSK
jgi:endonuclease YncB( thermonuclease family)